MKLLLSTIAVALISTAAYSQKLKHISGVEAQRNALMNQAASLKTLVELNSELIASGMHIAAPCDYVDAVLGIANSWPRQMLEIPQASNALNRAESAELVQLSVQAQLAIADAKMVNAQAACVKDNDLCCDQDADPVTDSCAQSPDEMCKLINQGGGPHCSAASDKCD